MSTPFYYPVSDSCQILTLAEIYEARLGKIADGHFVEVGAFDGQNWSNTYGLARLGWRGLLFEPQTHLYEQALNNHRNFNTVIENCCIGSYDGEIRLYLGGSISTTHAEMVDVYNDMDWSKTCGLTHDNYVTSPIYRLDTRLAANDWPEDFEVLVVDVEGAEMDVFMGLSLDRYRPKMMIVETHEDYPDFRLSHKATDVLDHVSRYGYEKIYHDIINSIYWLAK